ncbi:hypothetical protein ELY33_12290 [Vreelandella andesensis]|uniref:Uncharacterized protein n=1 Tax=Vreelandella andesensis TaxID=447567 RepID=A0A433KJD3_9GAMM|nr:hypothetical protein [Halomonas andesensis]RUR29717.1 hypothetical protein ELY33_12290 [Halomonas andesensis]
MKEEAPLHSSFNPRHRAYQLLYHATHPLRRSAFISTLTPNTPSCACCDRRWADVEAPFQAIEYRYGKNGETEYVCLSCYTPRIASQEMLGLERLNVTGNTRTPIYGKLGMLVGSGGIITPKAELYLTLPPKLFEKYRQGEWGQQSRLSTEKPLTRLLALLAQGELDPISEGFVYIENWGRKVDGLMRHLTPTTSLHELWCNSESGVSALDLHAMIMTAKQLSEQGLTVQADRITFWKPILDAAQGQRDDKAFAEWLEKVPKPESLLQTLPADPFDRLKLPAVLGAIMPHLQALLPYCRPLAVETNPAPQRDATPDTQRQGTLF